MYIGVFKQHSASSDDSQVWPSLPVQQEPFYATPWNLSRREVHDLGVATWLVVEPWSRKKKWTSDAVHFGCFLYLFCCFFSILQLPFWSEKCWTWDHFSWSWLYSLGMCLKVGNTTSLVVSKHVFSIFGMIYQNEIVFWCIFKYFTHTFDVFWCIFQIFLKPDQIRPNPDQNQIVAMTAGVGRQLKVWASLASRASKTENWSSVSRSLSATKQSMFLYFSRMRSEGSRFTWGSGGEAVFAKFCVCGRNRRQVFATVRNRLREGRKALHSGECVRSGPESVSSWPLSPQLYWRLQRRCLWEWSVSPQVYWCLQRMCLCEWSVSPQLYGCLQRRCLWEWSVSSQLYGCLQRRCQWEWSVSPQLYWRLQRRCLREWSVAPQLYWRLQRRCLREWSVAPQLYWCLQRRCQWEWSVSPQLYGCLQRRCLWEWSVSSQLYGCLQRRCQWEWSVSPQLYWRLQRRCLREWSVAPQLYWCLQRMCLREWSVSPQL